MTPEVQQVIDAHVEGRAGSLRFIQSQLSKLYTALLSAGDEVRRTIRDSSDSECLAEVQCTLTLETLQRLLHDSNFDKALKQEYNVARSENSKDHRDPYGIIYIVPPTFNSFYSVMSAVATAIAAGNCVIIHLPKTLSPQTNLVRSLLQRALGSSGTFAVTDQHLSSQSLPSRTLSLDYSGRNKNSTYPTLRPSSGRSIAVVDRSADLKAAASSILRARLSCSGSSPAAPDVVLVNEFVLKNLVRTIADLIPQYVAGGVNLKETGSSADATSRGLRKMNQELYQPEAEVLISDSKASVALITSRSSELLRKPISESFVILHPVRSLDDAIDFANSGQPLANLYTFAEPAYIKYIFQFVDADICFGNHIPIEHILAPRRLDGFNPPIGSPYTTKMFSRPKPQYIKPSAKSVRLTNIVEADDLALARKVHLQVQKIDPTVKQPRGHAIGFFEQGILIGLGVYLISFIGIGTVAWKGWKYFRSY